MSWHASKRENPLELLCAREVWYYIFFSSSAMQVYYIYRCTYLDFHYIYIYMYIANGSRLEKKWCHTQCRMLMITCDVMYNEAAMLMFRLTTSAWVCVYVCTLCVMLHICGLCKWVEQKRFNVYAVKIVSGLISMNNWKCRGAWDFHKFMDVGGRERERDMLNFHDDCLNLGSIRFFFMVE